MKFKQRFHPTHPIQLKQLIDCPVSFSRLRIGEVCGASIECLRPTQATVGMIQVYAQAKKMARMSRTKLEATLMNKPVPVVIGPDREIYILDHHHHVASLWTMGFDMTIVEIKEKFLSLSERAFWVKMRRSKWLHLYDESGNELHDHRLLPKRVPDLKDNIYQSLAWAARKEGAYAKSAVAVSDFKWPDFFRVRLGPVTYENFDKNVKRAVKLARSEVACGLPGHIRKAA